MDRAHEPLRSVLNDRREQRSRPARRGQDRELEAGARAHFEDPAYYTSTYASRTDDVVYYTRVASGRRAVLEYGVGNGRIALPIARAGSEVVGVDHSRAMIDDLRARLRGEPAEVRRRVRARVGDMRKVRLGRRFSLVICPFNTALHLYTREDVEAFLARVREHLEPRGELVLDVSMPILEDLADPPGTSYTLPPFEHPTAGEVSYREIFDYDRVRQILFVSMCFEPVGKGGRPRPKEAFMTPLAHRQFFPRELEALLHYNGFETTEVLGAFDGSPLTSDSDVMIVHARPRRGWRAR